VKECGRFSLAPSPTCSPGQSGAGGMGLCGTPAGLGRELTQELVLGAIEVVEARRPPWRRTSRGSRWCQPEIDLCLEASARRFQWVRTALVAATAATRSVAIASTAAAWTSSTLSRALRAPTSVVAHTVASTPRRADARRRHSSVRSTRDRRSLGGPVPNATRAATPRSSWATACDRAMQRTWR
jgi:hypothetical protein